MAAQELERFAEKWNQKYPYAIQSWRNNYLMRFYFKLELDESLIWDEFTVIFDFPIEIRKIIYTTNLIENLNGKIR